MAEFYTNKKLPGVGISIGLTRLFYQLKEAGLLPKVSKSIAKAMIIPMTSDMEYCIKIATELRNNNINTEIYYNEKSLKGKFNYANKLEIPFVIVIGEDEISTNSVTIKNMTTGEQVKVNNDINEILKVLNN